MNNFEIVKMPQTRSDLFQCLLRIKLRDEVGEGGRLIDEIVERSWAKFEGDVEEGVALFFAEVADDMRVVIGFL